MKTFYVSLTRDLLGCYLVATADSELAVRLYLGNEYMAKNGTWKLPWCSIYKEIPECDLGIATLIYPSRMKDLTEQDQVEEYHFNNPPFALDDEKDVT